jgi:serine/threonine protein kinase
MSLRTALYMAPEVRAGINRLCGRRSDMWSFGVLVAQMLLGREPLALMLSVLRVAQEPAREHSVMQAVQVSRVRR